MKRYFRRQKNSTAGFSLIEVLIVLILISIVAALAVLELKDWGTNQRVKTAARDMYSDFQRAKMEAVKANSNAIFSLTDGAAGAWSYQVFVDDGGTSGSGGTANNGIQDGDERVIAIVPDPADPDTVKAIRDVTMTSAFSLGSTAPGYTAAGLPYKKRLGHVIFDNGKRWFRLTLSAAGFVKLEMSTNGNDTTPTWK